MKLCRCISSLALALMSVLTMQATMSYVSIYYPDGEPTIEPTGHVADKAVDASKATNKVVDAGLKEFSSSIKSQRQKAVRQAWKEERKILQKSGEGTKKWSPSEKKELLKNGQS